MKSLEDSLRDKRILIIDDLVDARSSLKKMMQMLGANLIDTANDGRQASEYIAEHNYDIILSDYNLESGKDGQQVLEEARYTNRLKASSLYIMVTGENAIEMVMGALEYEPDNYITKPYTLAMIRDRLARILQIKNEFKAINAAIDAKNIDLAIELAQKAFKEKPKLVVPLSRILGKLYLRQEKFDLALNIYENLLKKRSVSWARLGQAICLYRLGKPQQAMALVEQALIKHPMYVQCYDLYAQILISLNKPVKAQQQLEKAIALSPKAVLRQIELGKIALKNNDLKVAEQAYDQAIKLGRYSCYKNSESYLAFIELVQQQLKTPEVIGVRKHNKLAEKTLRLLEEVKTDFHENKATQFDANLLEGHTYQILDKPSQAQISLEHAEAYLNELLTPDAERQLKMAQAFIDTNQHVKAQTIINSINSAALSMEQLKQYEILNTLVDKTDIQIHINELNSQGISLYSEQNYTAAIRIFDRAVSHQEASSSVLMNAIQTKVSYMEKNGIDIDYLKDCYQYFERIGYVSEQDSRHKRFSNLKSSFTKLWQSAGLD